MVERPRRAILSFGPAALVLWAMTVACPKVQAPSVLFPGTASAVLRGVNATPPAPTEWTGDPHPPGERSLVWPNPLLRSNEDRIGGPGAQNDPGCPDHERDRKGAHPLPPAARHTDRGAHGGAHAPSVLFPGIGIPVFCDVIARYRSTSRPQRVSDRPRTSGPPLAQCIALAVLGATFAPGLSANAPRPNTDHSRASRTGKPFLSHARPVASLCPRMQTNSGQPEREGDFGDHRAGTVRARHRNGARSPLSASGPCWARGGLHDRSRRAFLSYGPAALVLWAMSVTGPNAHAPSVLFPGIGVPVFCGVNDQKRSKPRPLRVSIRPLAIGPPLTLCMAFAVHGASFALSLSANDRRPVANLSDEAMIGAAPLWIDTAPLHTGSRTGSFDAPAMSNDATERSLAIVRRPFVARTPHIDGPQDAKRRHQRSNGRGAAGMRTSAGELRRTSWIRGPPPRGPLSCLWSCRSWATPPRVRRRSQRVDVGSTKTAP